MECIDSHYYLPMPWRCGKAELPNNWALACPKLHGLSKRLSMQGLCDVYDENINVMFSKCHAELVPEPEFPLNCIWYLPHHPVLN